MNVDKEGPGKRGWGTALSLAMAVTACHHAGGEGTSTDPNSAPPGQVWLAPAQVQQFGITTQKLSQTPVGAVIQAEGHVNYDDLHVTHVFPPVTGRVTRILAELGQRVNKGQALATIASPDVGVASSDLDKARADLIAAQRDAKRQRDLYSQRAASERDADNAEDAYERAKAEYNRAMEKAKLLRGPAPEPAKAALVKAADTKATDASGHGLGIQDADGDGKDDITQDYVLRSPLDGEVVARSVNPGSEVQGQYSGGAAAELFTVGQLDHVWVLADIFEKDVSRVSAGQKVTITLPSDPNLSFSGTVDWVSSVLDPAMRTATVRCVIENAQRKLKPEMFATVHIESTGTLMLTVPRESVVRMGDKTVVFAQTAQGADGVVHYERRPVIVDDAIEGEARVPVLHGVVEGEDVVTSGAAHLAEKI